MYSKKVKDYDSIEESQKIKGSNDMESDERFESGPKKNYKGLVVVIFVIVIFFCLLIFLFITRLNNEKGQINVPASQQIHENPKTSQNYSNNQKDLNQSIQQTESPTNLPKQNLQAQTKEILNQTFNINFKKRNHPNISNSELLPKIKKKTVNNISEILRSKSLNIKDKKITNEYIQFIKPLNETLEAKYRQILFPNLIFDNYSIVHIHNYSMYLSYLNKTSHKQDKSNRDNHDANKTNISNNKTIIPNKSANYLANQSLPNSINSDNNQTLNNTINMDNNQILNNTVNNVNNPSLSNNINSSNNQINNVNNQSKSNTINNSYNLTNQFNNSGPNITHGLRNLELNNNNSSYLRDFYLACDRKKLIIVKRNKSESYEEPIISVIIPFFNKRLELLRTIRSVQLQTLKNIEIIIVDDENTSAKKYYKKILDNDYRIRLFTQNKNLGVWRKRIDGFLYSRGEYILHINPGDILADSFVLEDLYNLVHQYNLDTVRFSFSKTNYDSKFKKNIQFNEKKIYPNKFTKIIYGTPGYDVKIFGYGTIYNRLVRSGIFRKALDLVDIDILNVHKDIWEDMWWNDLVDRVSFSNLIVNRLGYIFLYDIKNVLEPRSSDKFLREKTIQEFILFWFFDLKLLPKNNDKQMIIDNLKRFIRPDNKFAGETISLEYLIHRYEPYEILLISLIEDPFVSAKNKAFVYKLYQEVARK